MTQSRCVLLLCLSASSLFYGSEALLPLFLPNVARLRLSSVLQARSLGNSDFAKIFGAEEAAERQMRELATEYRPPPTSHKVDRPEAEQSLKTRKMKKDDATSGDEKDSKYESPNGKNGMPPKPSNKPEAPNTPG